MNKGISEERFNNIDDGLKAYNYATGKNLQLEPLGYEPRMEAYLDDETRSNLQMGELTVIGAGMLVAGYLSYKFL